MSMQKNNIRKLICLAVLIAIALLSFFVIAKPATNPETYRAIVQSIDEKKATVTGIAASAAAASTVLAAIPGDVTTPVANQIMEISSYLLIVVCALVLEKSLLTVMGFLAFKILIPIACACFCAYVLLGKKTLKMLAAKVLVFAFVIALAIPLSIKISDMIYDMNQETIAAVTTQVDQEMGGEETKDDQSWLDKIVEGIKTSVSSANEKAKQLLNRFIDAIALFLMAYCAMPILIILFILWFVKFLFGVNLPVPKVKELPVFKKENSEAKELQEV